MLSRFFIRSFVILAVSLTTATLSFAQTSSDGLWTQIDGGSLAGRGLSRQIVPNNYRTFTLNKIAAASVLNSAPEEFSDESRFVQTIISLPMPDGSYERFRIEHSLVVEAGLAAKFPELGRTYNGHGVDNPNATVRLDFLNSGFHGMILSQYPTVYIDPYSNGSTDFYISYRKNDLSRRPEMSCEFDTENADVFGVKQQVNLSNRPFVDSVINGSQLRTYRLALAATNEYTVAVGGNTVAGALAAQVLIMNRVNGVYERDLAIRMVTIANNNLIVYAGDNNSCGGPCTAANDPYSNSSPTTLLSQNQTNLDNVIGTANYDIGHVFSTGGGGVATLNSPCNASTKARGETGLPNPVGDGFAIDFVAHEMGHQFGGNHTFNNSCGGNRASSAAYEPGSGITIMGYAGVCSPQDLDLHSIDTFHVRSLEEMVAFREGGGSCGPATATGNTPPSVSVVGGPSFNIPKLTPFTLTATASDVNGDSITYDWQEYDLGPAATAVPNDDTDGQARPILRPYLPTTGGSRTFPSLQYILNNANVPPATYSGSLLVGERLPSIARTMNFQVIARDNRANGGGINTATATVVVDGANGPFAVTAPNTGVTFAGGSSQNVTWNVVNTNNAPVNAANVKISYSTDGGTTFPTTLLASTPNDGSQIVTIPIGNTTQARIKVEAVGNIFFDVSDTNFTVSGVAGPPRSRADFDGDGKTDLSVFRPSEGNWYLSRSTAGFLALHWGTTGDQLVPGDYDADGKTDVAVYRPTPTAGVADFYILNSATSTVTAAEWGTTGDLPVVGDYDGDSKSDVAVFRPSTGTWYILRSTLGFLATVRGSASSQPLSVDFDGDGKSDIVVYNPGAQQWLGTLSGGGFLNTIFGASGDKAVPADYDGDSKDDIALYRPSTGTWHIFQSSTGTATATAFGISTDVPVPGDYDGDGRDDVAVYRSGTWYASRSTSGLLIVPFGTGTDIAVPSAYVPAP